MKVFLSKLYKYNKQVNTHDLLKLLAVLTMSIDHLGYYFWVDCLWLRIIGRMAAPIFFFVFGTAKNFKFNYSLLICGIVLTLITYLANPVVHLNILINFVFIQWFFNKIKPGYLSTKNLVALFVICVTFLPFTSSIISYGSAGLLFAMSGYLIVQKDKRGICFMVAAVGVYFIKQGCNFGAFSQWTYLVVLAMVCLLLTGIFALYVLRSWPVPVCLKTLCLILSRYSLYIYVFQVGLGGLGLWLFMASSMKA